MIKIKITTHVPVEKKHGITIGRVFDAIISPTDIPVRKEKVQVGTSPYNFDPIYEEKETKDYYQWFYNGRNYFWVQGDAGEAVKIWQRECEIVEEK